VETTPLTLLWAALGFDCNGKRHRFRINRHLARFILVGLYTGTRHSAILSLQWLPNTAGGWFDLDAGMLYRRPQDAIETNKKRTPTPIPARLLQHLRRWQNNSTQYVIEHDGKPIEKMRKAWHGARELAGLGPDVTPHILKHTCATLLLQRGVSTWRVARLLGTSEQVIQTVYGHHAIDDLRSAIDTWSNRERPTTFPLKTPQRT
jgi:integrase